MATEPSFVIHRHQHDHTLLPERPASHPPHPRPRLPIRDLRFEYSYIHSIEPYVEFFHGTQGNESLRDDEDESGSRKESSTGEVVHIKWGKVAWITVRDQIISPLLQGAFWAIASHFLTPISLQVGHRVRSFLPSKEGRGVVWLRSWVRSLGFGTSIASRRS
ncbi:hypothetical protein L208DRAFT_1413555 [Tricholoma matsutake]|nr:hypothetical protein L208DRAFT_1413555 [Tricholoma matsutake 945]